MWFSADMPPEFWLLPREKEATGNGRAIKMIFWEPRPCFRFKSLIVWWGWAPQSRALFFPAPFYTVDPLFCSQMFSLCEQRICVLGVSRIWNWLKKSTGFLKFQGPSFVCLHCCTSCCFSDAMHQHLPEKFHEGLLWERTCELTGSSSGDLLMLATKSLWSALREFGKCLWNQSMCQSHFQELFSELTMQKQSCRGWTPCSRSNSELVDGVSLLSKCYFPG